MFLKIFYCSILVFLTTIPQIFASPSCEVGFKNHGMAVERRGNETIGELASHENYSTLKAADPVTRYTIQTARHLWNFIGEKAARRRVISIDDLNLPPSTNMEVLLAQQGFSRKFTEAVDLVNEWGIVRRRLQELKANPRATHIKYFADQIPDHIAYIRKGLVEAQSDPDPKHLVKANLVKKQLQALDHLEAKAKKAVSKNRVTYKWWLEFNFRLSRLMSNVSYNRHNILEMRDREQNVAKEYLSEFPSTILIPTIKGEKIGIIAFRKARENNVYPIGLIDRPYTSIHSFFISAYDTIMHDILHAGLRTNRHNPVFGKRLGEHIDALPPSERKKAEMVYFLMTHEGGLTDPIVRYNELAPQQLRSRIITSIYSAGADGLFAFPDPNKKHQRVIDLADTFMAVYTQALQHQ